MNIRRHESVDHFTLFTQSLMRKMLSPLCGINQEIGYIARSETDPKLMIGAGALTGIHVLFDRPNPGRGAYHIGGTGIFPEESMIRILAESVERYAQLMSDISFSHQLEFKSYREMRKGNKDVIALDRLKMFSDQQFARAHFPFSDFTEETKLSWIKMNSFQQNKKVYVPAQFVLVGYNIRLDDGEPWINSAVTTGTATHVSDEKALKAALLELTQLDSVMGHWYSSWQIFRIQFDDRLKKVDTLIKRSRIENEHIYSFYYLPNPDLIGFTVACVVVQQSGTPKTVVGLGADLSLEQAVYKSYLEAVSSVGLARMLIFKAQTGIDHVGTPLDSEQLYDLDRNVEYYGLGNGIHRMQDRFYSMKHVWASDLPRDHAGTELTHVQALIRSYIDSGKELFYLNLTGEEEAHLGLKVMRVWSPDTLSLCLPSAPQAKHVRFKQYGGFCHDDPHPYP